MDPAPSLNATVGSWQCGESDLKTGPNHRAFHGRWQMRRDGGVAGAKAMAEAEPALPHLCSDDGRKSSVVWGNGKIGEFGMCKSSAWSQVGQLEMFCRQK